MVQLTWEAEILFHSEVNVSHTKPNLMLELQRYLGRNDWLTSYKIEIIGYLQIA